MVIYNFATWLHTVRNQRIFDSPGFFFRFFEIRPVPYFPYINNYPGWYLSFLCIRAEYLSITLDPGRYFFEILDVGAANRKFRSWWIHPLV